MESKKRVIELYTESNPNPNSLKFCADFALISPGESFDFENPDSAIISPIATELFKFNFVERVFMCSNYITITKLPTIEWEEITPIL